ncbi:TPA: DNA polymerase III subunit beta [Candidatus Acetothermia bacterium]|nr:DNA polymerase III subunit beta [Candidatus Acetothermia bacterium]HAZ30055.1 DNA polymerase III subunit beta [Candidatus Acetothermia bacterium]
MEIVCRREDWVFGVRTVSHALGGRSAMPILGGIRCEGQGNEVELATTDLERSIRCRVPAQVKGAGVAVLSGQVLSQLVTRLPEADTIELHEEAGRARLTCGRTSFDLFTFAPDEFPEVAKPRGDPVGHLPLTSLLQSISQTAFAALRASETTRLALTGVDIVLREGTAKLAATNGYRLAIKKVAVDGLPPDYEGSFLVDAAVLTDLQRVLTGVGEETVVVYADAGQLHFVAGPVLFSCRPIKEQFPDFERVVPKDSEIGLFASRTEFLDTLRRLEITAADESGAVNLKVAGAELEMASSSKEKGAGHESVKLAKTPARGLEIAFKAEYLIDALRRMESEQVALWLSAPDRAGLIEPAGEIAPGDEGFIYVCMPVTLL